MLAGSIPAVAQEEQPPNANELLYDALQASLSCTLGSARAQASRVSCLGYRRIDESRCLLRSVHQFRRHHEKTSYCCWHSDNYGNQKFS